MAYNLGLNPRYRVNDHLTFRYGLEWGRRANEIGYVNGGLDTQEPLDQPFLDQILLGRRTVTTVTTVVSAAYTFTNRMSFTLRVRQYSSNVRYADFARLARGGDEQPVATSATATTPTTPSTWMPCTPGGSRPARR